MDLPETTKEITVEWLNDVLHENGFLGSANIISLTREQIGVGAGFLSDTAKLTLTFDRDASGLPKTMIAKLPPSYESARELGMRHNLFEREIRFYTEVAPFSPIRTPELIYGAMNPEKHRYVLLIEDCSYATLADQLQGLTYEQVKIVISKIADFHARWWESDELFSFQWMPKYQDDMIARTPGFITAWETCAKSETFKKILPEGGWAAGLKIVKQFPWLTRSLPGNKLTINQFDLKADNMFFDWGTQKDPFILFDWAPVCIGRGVTDLSRLLGSSLTPELRRQSENDLLKLYHNQLISKGITNYSFDQCQTDYLGGLLLRTGIPLVAYARLDHSDARGSIVVNTTLNRWFSAIVDNDATSILP